MKPFTLTLHLLLALLLFSCTTEEASEHERVSTHFNEDMGLQVSNQQWWRTAVKVNVSVTNDDKVELYLLSSTVGYRYLFNARLVTGDFSREKLRKAYLLYTDDMSVIERDIDAVMAERERLGHQGVTP
jgi:hypothetical protein